MIRIGPVNDESIYTAFRRRGRQAESFNCGIIRLLLVVTETTHER